MSIFGFLRRTSSYFHDMTLIYVIRFGHAESMCVSFATKYNSVQARDDSVQQDIIHRVPPSPFRNTRTRAQHIARPVVT